MSYGTERMIIRWVHLLFALPILGYIYGPASEVEQYAAYFRFVFVPVVVVTGLWMWKGHVLRRLFSPRRTNDGRTEK
jgi:thiosulfate reductase cytochrome b subunit